jgi:hypothetical protein
MKKQYLLDPVEIELSLRKIIEKNKRDFIGTHIVPDVYTIIIDEEVYEEYGELLYTLGRMLRDSIDTWLADKGYGCNTGTRVLFEKGDTEKKGFLVRISYQAAVEVAAVGNEAVPTLPDGEGESDMDKQKDDVLVGHLIDDDAGTVIPIAGKAVTIGRGEWCGINISDETVSERHARFRLEYGRNTLEDLSSTNGTRVNLKRIRKVVLSDGDRIALGSAKFTFRSGAPPADAPVVQSPCSAPTAEDETENGVPSDESARS